MDKSRADDTITTKSEERGQLMRTSGLRTTPPLAAFAPAIEWLQTRGVSSTRLASLLDTTHENIRVIAHRHRRRPVDLTEILLPPHLSDLNGDEDKDAEIAEQQRCTLPIRENAYFSEDRGKAESLEWLEDQIEWCVAEHVRANRFLQGERALRQLLPYFGRSSDVRLVRLLAKLHRHRAWFLVHTGRCVSASEAALLALDLAQYCYRESRRADPADLQEVVEAAQIASNAALLSRRPSLALEILDIVKQAYEQRGEKMGSEYHRQSGTAYFQQGETEPAGKHFAKAMDAMRDRGEARNEAHLLMTGTRHLNLLPGFDWDRSQEIHDIAVKQFGRGSLEEAINMNWAVACGLATGSRDTRKEAHDLLTKAHPVPAMFGHQNTVRTLLAITPELGLDDAWHYEWIRRTLYENSLRNR